MGTPNQYNNMNYYNNNATSNYTYNTSTNNNFSNNNNYPNHSINNNPGNSNSNSNSNNNKDNNNPSAASPNSSSGGSASAAATAAAAAASKRNEGEEYGLVPSRYLKRKEAAEDSKRKSHLHKKKNSCDDNSTSSSFNNSNDNKNNNNNIARDNIMLGNNHNFNDNNKQTSFYYSVEEERDLVHELDRILARHNPQTFGSHSVWRDSAFWMEWKESMLRAESYKVHETARRIENHWRLKQELFGYGEKILWNDMPTEIAEDGYAQLLPVRDLSGRAMICFKYDHDTYSKHTSEFRKYLYYMFASALEDEETQHNGIVFIVFNYAPTWILDSFWWAWKALRVPFRVVRLHYCAIDTSESSYTLKEHEDLGTMIRIHQGSHQECLHGLMTFGVPSHLIPFSHDGGIQLERHTTWFEWRKRTDYFGYQRWRIVLVPGRNDILFGHKNYNKSSSCSQGNIRYHRMLLSNAAEYKKATEDERAIMRDQIFKSLQAQRSLFLQPIHGGILWERMDDATVLSKMALAFEFLASHLDGKGNSRYQIGDWGWYDIFLGKECCQVLHCNEQSKCVPRIGFCKT